MLAKGLMTLVATGVMALGLASAALADMGPIESRQACMKANGAAMKVMVPMFKGEAPFDKAAIDAALGDEAKACAGWAGWWGEDTKAGGAVKTRAADAIWTDPAGFDAAGAAYVKASAAVKAATDEAAFKAAFPAFGAACQGCHEKFRLAEQ
jgi:cytochrome c556